jgi:hypothetical protein
MKEADWSQKLLLLGWTERSTFALSHLLLTILLLSFCTQRLSDPDQIIFFPLRFPSMQDMQGVAKAYFHRGFRTGRTLRIMKSTMPANPRAMHS